MNGLLEILTNKEWMINPEYAKSIASVIGNNLTNHIPFEAVNKDQPFALVNTGKVLEPVAYQVLGDGEIFATEDMPFMNRPFVNIMPVTGPITRNGGACSYGSVDIRDWIMQAAEHKFCKGHIFYINTPGGSAWAKNDFKQGIDYAHEKGQKVIAFIDGDCLSAGMYLASFCDEVIVMNGEDNIGCIGVLCEFFSLKNGQRTYTEETFHELYDPESYDKNREYRDVVDGDDRAMIEHLAELGVEFRSEIKRAFPNAQDDMIHGKIYKAKDVMGVFVDGIMTLNECVNRVFGMAEGAVMPIRRVEGEFNIIQDAAKDTHTIQSDENMNLIEKMRSLLSQAESEQAENANSQADEITALNERINAIEAERDEARQQVEELTKQRDELNEAVVIDGENISNLQEQVNTLTEQNTALTDEVAGLNEQVSTLTEQNAAKDVEIHDLKEQLGSNFVPQQRMNGIPASEGDKNEPSSEERKNEIRDRLNSRKK